MADFKTWLQSMTLAELLGEVEKVERKIKESDQVKVLLELKDKFKKIATEIDSRLETRLYLSRPTADQYEAYPSGIRMHSTGTNQWIDIDIQLLAKLVDEWQKANPQVNFKNYLRESFTPLPKPRGGASASKK